MGDHHGRARQRDLKKELDAALQTRRERGEEYESALVDSFLEKVDQRIDAAVERRVRRGFAQAQTATARDSRLPQGHRLVRSHRFCDWQGIVDWEAVGS
ncbi:hypothetical protein [Streptomyces sp. NBC_00582]|uniref:hypothetical protein n=1 Tax=Streptomyces sp. NBC_00582 TaxID=2975783 RepID=UPI003FCEB275